MGSELITVVYKLGFWLVFLCVFLGAWVYCISEYGFLLGVGLGWLPAGIAALIIAALWPLIVAGAALLYVYLDYMN